MLRDVLNGILTSAEHLEDPGRIRSIRLSEAGGVIIRIDDGAETHINGGSPGPNALRKLLGENPQLHLRPSEADVVSFDSPHATVGDRWGHLLYALGGPGTYILSDFGLHVQTVRREGATATVTVSDGAETRRFSVDLTNEVDLGIADDFVMTWDGSRREPR